MSPFAEEVPLIIISLSLLKETSFVDAKGAIVNNERIWGVDLGFRVKLKSIEGEGRFDNRSLIARGGYLLTCGS
jgi:hypothetical protein